MFPRHKISINQRAAAGKLPLLEPMCLEEYAKVALILICNAKGIVKKKRKKHHPSFIVSLFAPLHVEDSRHE
jgi:hypothetical protein